VSPFSDTNMPEELYTTLTEETFGRFKLEIRRPQALKYLFQPFQLFLEGLSEQDYVIEVDPANLIGQSTQHYVHQTLEYRGGTRESKRHNRETETPLTRDEGRLVTVRLCYGDIVVSRPEVQRAVP